MIDHIDGKITGELAKYVEYLKEETRILRVRIPGQIHTRPHERLRLLKYGKAIGRAIVLVREDQLSLAIGRRGQNVRLASELMGWRIDVKSEQKYAKLMEDGFKSLVAIEGIDDHKAEILYDGDITSAAELSESTAEDVAELLEDIDTDQALALIVEAGKVAAELAAQADPGDSKEADDVEKEAVAEETAEQLVDQPEDESGQEPQE